MEWLGRAPWLAAATIACAIAGCASGTGADVAGEADVEIDHQDPDAPTRADVDEDVGASDAAGRGGPATLVISELSVTVDRLCDHDGDGIADNAIAELGSPGAGILAMGLSTYVRGTIESGGNRIVAHAPWVDDLEIPHDDDMRLIIFDGLDGNGDPTDDFSGEEPFFVSAEYLDPCGEPTRVLDGLSIDRGAARGGSGTIPTPLGANVPGLGGQAFGTVEPGAGGAELDLCFYVLARDLGASSSGLSGLSYLEIFLAGGAVLGLSAVPGITLDIDLDGDGLERFELDADGRIEACLDGDRTVIAGRDCWLDTRIADGLSLALSMTAVAARLEGLENEWEEWATETCGGTFLCEHGCSGTCLCPPPCDAASLAFDSLEECLALECPEECGQAGARAACWYCGALACGAEQDACLASECCPDPPDTSVWDPN